MEPMTAENRRRADVVEIMKEVLAAGFEFVDYSDLHYRPDDELRYEVGRHTVTGNTHRFTLLYRKPYPARSADTTPLRTRHPGGAGSAFRDAAITSRPAAGPPSMARTPPNAPPARPVRFALRCLQHSRDLCRLPLIGWNRSCTG
jgi:hypothetical protein